MSSKHYLSDVGVRLFLLGDAADVVRVLLESDGTYSVRDLVEASVHRPARGKVWIAVFTGPEPDKQIWRSTGTRDFRAARRIAKNWERDARSARMTRTRGPRPALLRVRRRIARSSPVPTPATGLLSQAAVAVLLKISTRAVGRAERSAISKLRRNPIVRELMREYFGREIDETLTLSENARTDLTDLDVMTLRGLARTAPELRALNRVLTLIGTGAVQANVRS